MTALLPDAQALLDAWRQRGADRIDPVRFGVIDALHRRAARYEGKVRERLNQRLATLMQAYADRVAAAARGRAAKPDVANIITTSAAGGGAAAGSDAVAGVDGVAGEDGLVTGTGTNTSTGASTATITNTSASTTTATAPATPQAAGFGTPAPCVDRNARVSHAHHLGALPAYIAAQRAAISAGTPALPWTGRAYPELPLLDEVREIWGRLSADLQLQHFEQDVPQNAGPLNSIHLVHRALSHMRASSPAYLHHFLAHAEALAWLEAMGPAAAAPSASAARPSSTRKKPGKPKKKTTSKAKESA